MAHSGPAACDPVRSATLSVNADLLAQARTLEVDITAAAESGLERAIAERKAEHWLKENREALESSNAYIDRHGLPLARYRTF